MENKRGTELPVYIMLLLLQEIGINKCERPRQKTAGTNLSQTNAVTGPVNPTWGINRRGAINHMFIIEPSSK